MPQEGEPVGTASVAHRLRPQSRGHHRRDEHVAVPPACRRAAASPQSPVIGGRCGGFYTGHPVLPAAQGDIRRSPAQRVPVEAVGGKVPDRGRPMPDVNPRLARCRTSAVYRLPSAIYLLSMLSAHPDGVIVEVWVVPGSSRDSVGGSRDGALRVRTIAPAEARRANRAVAQGQAHLGGRRAGVIASHTSRNKRVLVVGLSPSAA